MTSAVYSLWVQRLLHAAGDRDHRDTGLHSGAVAEQSLPRQEITLRLLQGRLRRRRPPEGGAAPRPEGREPGAESTGQRGGLFAPCRGWRRAILQACVCKAREGGGTGGAQPPAAEPPLRTKSAETARRAVWAAPRARAFRGLSAVICRAGIFGAVDRFADSPECRGRVCRRRGRPPGTPPGHIWAPRRGKSPRTKHGRSSPPSWYRPVWAEAVLPPAPQ